MESAQAPLVLAQLTDGERAEYALRMSLHTAKQAELSAAAAWLTAYGEELRIRHELPSVFDLNLQTGEVLARG